MTDLAAVAAGVLGVAPVESMAGQLEDPFTAGNVRVTLAGLLTDPATKREQLVQAEALATGVREGDRDFALRWVFEGYRRAGLPADAERLRGFAATDPEVLTLDEAAILAAADSALAQADTIVSRRPADTLTDRLRRYMKYGFNDLKVLLLVDASRKGDRDSGDLEAQLAGPCGKSTPNANGTTTTSFSWDNCISSVKVAPGWRATLYGDCVSSIRVSR